MADRMCFLKSMEYQLVQNPTKKLTAALRSLGGDNLPTQRCVVVNHASRKERAFFPIGR